MKQLRRMLALVLAALLSGLLCAGAAEVPSAPPQDMDLVQNREAVQLMLDLDIMAGRGSGSFDPEESLDRGSISRMIFALMMGSSSPDLFLTVKTELDDIDGHWAEGYIKYCYSVGIVSGVGGHRFDPQGNVSVASAAKMLLVALGFDAKHRGYEGNSLWASNIMQDAQTLGLMSGISQSSFEPLTRDNAAQMFYNALFCSMRDPIYRLTGLGKEISGYRVRPTTLGLETFGLVRYILTVGDVTSDRSQPELTFVSAFPGAAQISGGATINNLLRSGAFSPGPELAAHNVAIYVQADYTLTPEKDAVATLVFRAVYSTALSVRELSSLGSSTNGTPISAPQDKGAVPDLVHKFSGNAAFIAPLDGQPAVRYFLNGSCVTAQRANEAALLRGAIVDLLDADRDGAADMVKISVKSVYTLTANAELRTENGVRQVRVPGAGGLTSWTPAALVSNWADLQRGDVVLVLTLGKHSYLEKAQFVFGTATEAKQLDEASALVIGGVAYAPSQLVPNPIDGWQDFASPYYFYLDNSGAIIKTVREP